MGFLRWLRSEDDIDRKIKLDKICARLKKYAPGDETPGVEYTYVEMDGTDLHNTIHLKSGDTVIVTIKKAYAIDAYLYRPTPRYRTSEEYLLLGGSVYSPIDMLSMEEYLYDENTHVNPNEVAFVTHKRVPVKVKVKVGKIIGE